MTSQRSGWRATSRGEFSPLERAFYQAEPEGRRALLAAARRGGSVTPAVARLLCELERRGGLRVALGVEADGVRWTGGEWEVRWRRRRRRRR